MNYIMEDEIIGIRLMKLEETGLHFEITRQHTELQIVHEWLCAHLQDEINSGKKIIYTAIDKLSGEICGFCQLNMENKKEPEIGIDIVEKYKGKGYGYRAVSLIIEVASRWRDVETFVWNVYSHNTQSRRLAEKLGGVMISEGTLLLEEFIEYGFKNNLLKEDDITKVCKYLISKRV